MFVASPTGSARTPTRRIAISAQPQCRRRIFPEYELLQNSSGSRQSDRNLGKLNDPSPEDHPRRNACVRRAGPADLLRRLQVLALDQHNADQWPDETQLAVALFERDCVIKK